MLMLKELVRSKAGHDSDPHHVRTSLQSLPQIPSAMDTTSPPTRTRVEAHKPQKPSLRSRWTGYNSRNIKALEANKTIHPASTPTSTSTTACSSDGTGQLSRCETSNTSVSQLSLATQNSTSTPSNGQYTQSIPLHDGALSGHVRPAPVQKDAASEILAPISELVSTVTPNELSKTQDIGRHTALTGIKNLTVSSELKEATSEKFLSPVRICADCFIAMNLEIKAELTSEFEKIEKPKLRAFLQHLRLDDARISLDCAMAGRTSAMNTFKPTILFICFNERQKKAIETGLAGQRNLVSTTFVCRVVVQELRLISSFISTPSEPGSLSGQIVEANMHPRSVTLCGIQARLMAQEDLIMQPVCTIGGLIRVGGTLYALTTAHSFTGDFSRTTTLGASFSNFVPLGNLYSYKFTEAPPPSHGRNDSGQMMPFEIPEESPWEGHDWALIRVLPGHFMHNLVVDPNQYQTVPVEGHLRSDQLSQGNVWVCSSSSGVINGFLNATEGSVMMGSSVFSVRSIMLDKELADGDSGSWVVRDGKVCGYLFCRVVGSPLAYMLPIGPVLEDIRLAFGLSDPNSVEVPSDTNIQELCRNTTFRKKVGARSNTATPLEIFVHSEETSGPPEKRSQPVLGRIPEERSNFEKGKGVAASPPVEMDTGPFSNNPKRFASDSMSESSRTKHAFGSAIDTLVGSTDSSDASDEDVNLCVQTPLPTFRFDHEILRHHLKSSAFGDAGKVLLESVVENGRLIKPTLFPDYSDDERWHNSHYSVFDVGQDGAAVSRREAVKLGATRIDSAIWQAIRALNADPTSERVVVGRISIIREPSSIIFGALHLVYNKDFDMDELFQYLVATDSRYLTTAHMQRAFNADPRQRRSFFFSFQYLTIVGEDIDPMPWQMSHDDAPSRARILIGLGRLSRCSSIVALSLSGNPIRPVTNLSLSAQGQYGFVHDPWAAWQVLNIQCYPDHKHSMVNHNSTKHYVNGPEAFMFTLLGEYKDAKKRFEALYKAISKFTIPPVDFIFNTESRDRRLFDDENLTFSRRYFWAYEMLRIISADIKSLIDAYQDSFTDDVWDGRHKTIWPMIDKKASRSVHWRKRMNTLKKDFQKEIKSLEQLLGEYDDRRKEIMTLRDQLLAGASVLQGRRMIEQASIIVLQAHNIKLLAFVTILFLPLIFVACLFGMTSMPGDQGFRNFAIVIVSVCLPFYLLIGTLNGDQRWWRGTLHRIASFVEGRMSRVALGTRHRVAKSFIELSERLTSAPSDQLYGNLEYSSGLASNYPEVPGEVLLNPKLRFIEGRYSGYSQSQGTDGNATPGDLSQQGNKITLKDIPPASTSSTKVESGAPVTS